MPLTTSAFRNKQKEILGEISQTGAQPSFTDPQLDSWRNSEVEVLYGDGIYKVATTRGLVGYVETVITADAITGYVPRYIALPPLWRRVMAVEIFDQIIDQPVQRVTRFDDLELPGYVRIDELDNYIGVAVGRPNIIRLRGEAEYTGVDDPYAHGEVTDMVLFGSCIRALISEYMKRIKVKQVARGNNRESSLVTWHMSSAIAQLRVLKKDARAKALNIQRATTQAV